MKQLRNKSKEDDIGPKIDCFVCSNSFYYFEYNDHLQLCIKSNPLYQAENDSSSDVKPEQVRKDNEREKSPEKQKPEEQKVEKKEEENDEAEEQEKMKEEIPKESKIEDSWLQKFELHKSKISRLVEKKSKVNPKNKKKQEIKQVQKEQEELFSELPCPFCGKVLNLSEIDHIDKCETSQQCIHCHDKYPKSLMMSHHRVCQQNKRRSHLHPRANQPKKSVNSSKIGDQKKKIEHPPMRFSNERPQENAFQPVNYLHNFRAPARRQQQWQQLDPRILDQQSQMHKKEMKGLSQRQINSLEWQLFVPVEGSQESKECTICASNLEVAEEVISLKCRHLFHRECLLPWLKERSTCPTCKGQIKCGRY